MSASAGCAAICRHDPCLLRADNNQIPHRTGMTRCVTSGHLQTRGRQIGQAYFSVATSGLRRAWGVTGAGKSPARSLRSAAASKSSRNSRGIGSSFSHISQLRPLADRPVTFALPQTPCGAATEPALHLRNSRNDTARQSFSRFWEAPMTVQAREGACAFAWRNYLLLHSGITGPVGHTGAYVA